MQLVISDCHRGLVNAVAAVLQGASWQRCRVHFLRNVLAKVRKGDAEMVAAAIRTIFAQPTGPAVRDQVDIVAGLLADRFPAVAAMLHDAKADVTAFADFPEAHWKKIRSTNPLERLNKEIKRRTDVVGISRTRRRCSASPAPSSSKPTTNGRPATVGTYRRRAWPRSPRRRRRYRHATRRWWKTCSSRRHNLK